MEIWKDIPGYEGSYQVSDLGRVRSLDREVECGSRWGHLVKRKYPGKVLKPCKHPRTGHLMLQLGCRLNGAKVHQLVMLAFEGPCRSGFEVCHNNGDPADNHWPENLRYDTKSGNAEDKLGHGTCKVKRSDVIEIRRRWSARESTQVALAEEYMVSKGLIAHIIHKRVHSHA